MAKHWLPINNGVIHNDYSFILLMSLISYVQYNIGGCRKETFGEKRWGNFSLLFMQVILGPEKMITIPPRHYCIVENPVLRDKDGRVLIDANGQIKLGHADQVLYIV